MRGGRRVALIGLAVLLAGPPVALAQVATPGMPLNGGAPASPLVVDTPEPTGEGILPVVTLDQDALYAGSEWGKRVKAELDKRSQDIAAENDRLANQFSAEEQQLSALRLTLPADEFRKRAEDFDKRVVDVRRQFEEAGDALNARAASEFNAFSHAMLPVLAALMRERGAVVVLDKRAILVAARTIDVTETLTERVDREIGAGPLSPETPGPQVPEIPAPVTPDGTTPNGTPPDGAAPAGAAPAE